MRVREGTIDIQADEAGQGEPVVMIHSSGMSSRQWRHLARVISSTHRAVMPDLLGYGGTVGWDGAETFTLDRDLAVVLAVVKAVQRPVHLVGHSYGGMLALMAARALDRDRVRSIAVYEPVAWGAAFDDAGGAVKADLARFGDAFFSIEEGGSLPWFRSFIDYWNGPGSWDALPEAQRASFLAVGRKVFLEVRELCSDRTPREVYRAIEAPTSILRGDSTTAAESRVCEVLAEVMPRATLETIAGVGHMGILIRADEVSARIAAHVRAS
jgi:pimeloyl-ACP methyl ester carboxylesterase